MLSSDAMRGYNDTLILGLLCEGDSYGYALSREIERRSGGRYTIRETTLYSAMNRLEKQGHIAAYHGAETLGRPRTYYTVTDAGRGYFAEKCDEWQVIRQIVDRFTTDKEESNGNDS